MKTDEGAQGHEGAFLGHDALRGTGAFPYIGNAPSDAPNAPGKGQHQTDPLATPGLIRFLLGKTASAMLTEAGDYFVIQACRSAKPEDEGRFVMFALPTSKDVCDQCARIAAGTHRAIAIRKPKLSTP